MLSTAGIKSFATLRRLGSVAAYAKVKATNEKASLNLLWALEGALIGAHWRQVAKEHRTRLLFALDDYLRAKRRRS